MCQKWYILFFFVIFSTESVGFSVGFSTNFSVDFPINFPVDFLIMLDGSIHFATVFLCFQRLPFVVLFFASTKRNIDLRPTILVDENQRRNNRVARLFSGIFQMADFALRQEQFPLALRLVVGVGTVEIGRNIHSLHPDFAVHDVAISIDKRSLARTNRLDFRAGQHNARRQFLNEKIFEGGLLVLDLYRTFLPKFLLLLVHIVAASRFLRIAAAKLHIISDFPNIFINRNDKIGKKSKRNAGKNGNLLGGSRFLL